VPDATEPADLVGLACDLARAAGSLIVEGRRRGLHHVGTKSSRTDMVTEYDRASERLITERLRAARPSDAIVGEEGGMHAGTSGVDWLVDPIDGTTNFLYDLPNYAVSIAARDAAGVAAGAVFLPVLGELFHATRGGGAFLNGEAIRCSDKADVATALVATGFGYDPARRVRQGAVLAKILGSIRDIRRLGAAAADLCYVACGRFDAYFERGLEAWDLAAGGLIAREAGAIVTGFDGGPARPGEAVAANPTLHPTLLALLHDAGA
jgi:myo-inositol-1(or 4)-monophosphatase